MWRFHDEEEIFDAGAETHQHQQRMSMIVRKKLPGSERTAQTDPVEDGQNNMTYPYRQQPNHHPSRQQQQQQQQRARQHLQQQPDTFFTSSSSSGSLYLAGGIPNVDYTTATATTTTTTNDQTLSKEEEQEQGNDSHFTTVSSSIRRSVYSAGGVPGVVYSGPSSSSPLSVVGSPMSVYTSLAKDDMDEIVHHSDGHSGSNGEYHHLRASQPNHVQMRTSSQTNSLRQVIRNVYEEKEDDWGPTSGPSNAYPTGADEDRQRCYDEKMAQMEHEYYENRIRRASHRGRSNVVQNDTYQQDDPRIIEEESLSQQEQSHPTYLDSSIDSKVRGMPVNSIDYGMNAAPDVEYGELTRPILPHGTVDDDDSQLAMAIEINDEDDDEEEEEKEIVHAIEYDPDSKPPIYLNRRFRLYGVGSFVLLVVIASIAVMAISSLSKEDKTTITLTASPTIAPTPSPTTDRQATYRNFFANRVSPLVYVPGTAQYLAAEWIMDDDPVQLQPNDGRLIQRYILAFLYFHSTNNGKDPWRSCNPATDGDDENDMCIYLEFTRAPDNTITYEPQEGRFRWLSAQHECDWVGVLCGGGASVLGVELFGQQLQGSLPTELAAIPFLQKVSLAYNEITGTIPPEYGRADNLLALELHGNLLTGTIPDTVYEQSPSQLILLNVGENMMEGTIDTRIGRLTNLKGLHIFENNFEGTIPTEIERLPNLAFVRFNGNEFNGAFPTGLGSLRRLVELWGHELDFTGQIPTELGYLTRLTDLRIGGNQLTGTIPQEVWELTKLIRLSVRDNRLTGTLSPMVQGFKALQILEVSENQLTGQIPTAIRALPNLKAAWFHLNNFEGELPQQICDNVLADGTGIVVLQADCFPDEDPPVPCDCCTSCCNRETRVCLQSDSG